MRPLNLVRKKEKKVLDSSKKEMCVPFLTVGDTTDNTQPKIQKSGQLESVLGLVYTFKASTNTCLRPIVHMHACTKTTR